MTIQEFLKAIESINSEKINTIRKKNSDYAGGEGVEPWKNFEFIAYALRGVDLNSCDLVELGIFTRMLDKCARISTLLSKDPDVSTESISDTLTDLSAYSDIFRVYRENKQHGAKKS